MIPDPPPPTNTKQNMYDFLIVLKCKVSNPSTILDLLLKKFFFFLKGSEGLPPEMNH